MLTTLSGSAPVMQSACAPSCAQPRPGVARTSLAQGHSARLHSDHSCIPRLCSPPLADPFLLPKPGLSRDTTQTKDRKPLWSESVRAKPEFTGVTGWRAIVTTTSEPGLIQDNTPPGRQEISVSTAELPTDQPIDRAPRPNTSLHFNTMLSIGLGVGVGGGPSRMVLRRLAAHSRPVLVPRTGAAPTLASLRLLSTSTPVLAVQRPAARSKQPRQLKDVRNQLSETEWPWRPLPNGEEERVIFSRPVTTDPRMMWVFAVLWLGGVVTWVVMPSDRETSEYIAKQFPDAPKAEPW